MFFSKLFRSRTVSSQDTRSSVATGAAASLGKPACDRFLDRTDKDKLEPETGERYCADKEVMIAALEAMPLDARGDVVASMALLAAPPDRSVRSIHRGKLKMLLEACMSTELPRRPDVVESITAIMAEPSNNLSAHYASGPYLTYLRAAKAEGIDFTEQQRGLLIAVAERAETHDINRSGKGFERRNRQRGHEFRALVDAVPDAGDLLAKRLVSQPSPNRLRPLPDNIDFWCAFLDRVAKNAETLARELAAEALPDWAVSPAAFNARFVSIAGMPVEFGFWRRPELKEGHHYDWREFWAMRGAPLEYRGQFDLPSLSGPDLRALRERMAPLAEHEWGKEWLPAAGVLLGEGSEDDRGLLKLMIDAPDGTQPPSRWKKRALDLAGRIGTDVVRRRTLEWLAVFHTPGVSPETLKELELCHTRAIQSHAFERQFPQWTGLGEDEIDRLADWVALVALGYSTSFRTEIRCFWEWYRRNSTPPASGPGLGYPDSIGERLLDYKMTHVMPTTENDKVLRSAAWLLGMLPAPECVDALERTAIAATAIKRSDNYRSRTTANAAIASLGTLGTAEALHAETLHAETLHALGRLRRVIKDRAIGNSVQKAMAAVADKLGVAVDDIAEMSVPDYALS
jgi:hypothetical protein